MTDSRDYTHMYDELGLTPGCGMDQLKRAYRRRVGQLHPDLNGAGADLAKLQQLNQIYSAALDFHRTHGRLPGQSPDRRYSNGQPLQALEIAPLPPSAPSARRRLARVLLTLTVLAIAASTIFLQQHDPPRRPPEQGRALPPAVARAEAGEAMAIHLGMHKHDVLALLGQPHVDDNDRWVYGPSWVQLHCGQVVDWYSSPLRPLLVASSQPPDRHTPPAHACLHNETEKETHGSTQDHSP